MIYTESMGENLKKKEKYFKIFEPYLRKDVSYFKLENDVSNEAKEAFEEFNALVKEESEQIKKENPFFT